MGLGPSAHSFDGNSRSWNVSSIKNYNKAVVANDIFIETEQLSTDEKYNEYIMVSLRTKEGVNTSYLKTNFGINYFNRFLIEAERHKNNNSLIINDEFVFLTVKGILISNLIIEDFIIV